MVSEHPPTNLAHAVEGSARRYRPIDLARDAGMSPSQVRNYEKLGFLPPARRTSSGYRSFSEQHLEALRVARCLKKGYGWSRALAAMQAVHSRDFDLALSVADERHADIHSKREQITQALAALDAARQDVSVVLGLHLRKGRTISIGEAAAALGVNTSAIRYWESRGALNPIRAEGNRRRYDSRLLQQLQLIKLLRDINYDFDTITAVVNDLSNSTGAKARQALDQRRVRVQQASRAAAQATTTLLTYIKTLEVHTISTGSIGTNPAVLDDRD